MKLQDLTAEEKRHLGEHKIPIALFSGIAEHQLKMRQMQIDAVGKIIAEPCHICKRIARKLGLPVEPDPV
jgi:hypothetical protein